MKMQKRRPFYTERDRSSREGGKVAISQRPCSCEWKFKVIPNLICDRGWLSHRALSRLALGCSSSHILNV